MERKLPEIYQPQLNPDKITNIDINNKMKQKQKSSSTCAVLESRKTDTNLNEQRKV